MIEINDGRLYDNDGCLKIKTKKNIQKNKLLKQF